MSTAGDLSFGGCVENAFPELKVTRAFTDEESARASVQVTGEIADLLRYGFLTPEIVRELPPYGLKCFEGVRKTGRSIETFRNKNGTVRVCGYYRKHACDAIYRQVGYDPRAAARAATARWVFTVPAWETLQ